MRVRAAPAPATRLISLDDAPVLAAMLRDNRDFMAPFEPARAEAYFTDSGQLALIRDLLARHEQGQTLPHVILDEDGSVVGRITLNEIVRGPFQSCSLGYWVAASANGRGLATAAVRDIVRVAFEDLGLHRIQAGTLPGNVRSQRVLETQRLRPLRPGAGLPQDRRTLAGPRALPAAEPRPAMTAAGRPRGGRPAAVNRGAQPVYGLASLTVTSMVLPLGAL